jgi:hypothetical protein
LKYRYMVWHVMLTSTNMAAATSKLWLAVNEN